MKEDNLISLLVNIGSVEKIDELPEVQYLIFGEEIHRQMIIDYNSMLADYSSNYTEIIDMQNEIYRLYTASGLVRLLRGKRIDEKIADLEKRIEEVEEYQRGINLMIEEALRCIQNFELEMKNAAKNVFATYGLTVDQFIEAYNKAKSILTSKGKPAESVESQTNVGQKGE